MFYVTKRQKLKIVQIIEVGTRIYNNILRG
jgi:hypothetical protein